MNTDLAKVQKLLDWVKRLLYLDIISSSAKKRIVKRGQVYWCDFGCAVGSEMQKTDLLLLFKMIWRIYHLEIPL